jgi:hypothetical protein
MWNDLMLGVIIAVLLWGLYFTIKFLREIKKE